MTTSSKRAKSAAKSKPLPKPPSSKDPVLSDLAPKPKVAPTHDVTADPAEVKSIVSSIELQDNQVSIEDSLALLLKDVMLTAVKDLQEVSQTILAPPSKPSYGTRLLTASMTTESPHPSLLSSIPTLQNPSQVSVQDVSHQNDDLVYPTTVKTPSICHNTSTPGTAVVDVPPSQETICEEPIMVQHAHPAYSIDSSQYGARQTRCELLELVHVHSVLDRRRGLRNQSEFGFLRMK